MDEFNNIVSEFEAVVDKLAAWYNYYKEEDLLIPVSVNDHFCENLGKQIAHLKTDAMLLKVGSTIIQLNEVAKTFNKD